MSEDMDGRFMGMVASRIETYRKGNAEGAAPSDLPLPPDLYRRLWWEVRTMQDPGAKNSMDLYNPPEYFTFMGVEVFPREEKENAWRLPEQADTAPYMIEVYCEDTHDIEVRVKVEPADLWQYFKISRYELQSRIDLVGLSQRQILAKIVQEYRQRQEKGSPE